MCLRHLAIHANKQSSRKRTGKSGQDSSKHSNGGEHSMTCVEERLYEEEKLIALKDLRLDPQNVRFRQITKPMKEKEMEGWLYGEEDVRTLIKQLQRDRCIQQPIYVKEDGEGHYIVKEGNRRTVALRKISLDILQGKIKGFEKGHFDVVPVMILKGSDHDINVFLGQIHTSGPKEWKAVNKASVIYTLMEKYGDPLESVAEELGMTRGKTLNHYKAFQATEKYGKRYPEDKNPIPKYSYFAELYQSKVLKNWMEEDPSRLDYFIDLVGQNKLLVTYKGVRSLAKIVASPNPTKTKAMTVLDAEDGNIEKAMAVLNENPSLSKGVWATIDKVLKSLKQASYQEFVLAIHDSSKQQLLNEVIEAASNMKENIKELQKKEVYQK